MELSKTRTFFPNTEEYWDASITASLFFALEHPLVLLTTMRNRKAKTQGTQQEKEIDLMIAEVIDH
jgi:hypothetical protein